MNRTTFTSALRAAIARPFGSRALVTASLACALAQAGASASAEQFEYKGVDATYQQIKMDLYLTRISATTFDATGTIYLGNYIASVKGTFTGSSLNALVATQRIPVTGTLSGGALGRGSLAVRTGNVLLGNRSYMLSFRLAAIGGPGVQPPPQPQPQPQPKPAPMDFHGTAGFGYTKVDLNMHFQPNGNGTYAVTGRANVHTIRPQIVDTNLQIAGTYNPNSAPARFPVTGAPPQSKGNTPMLGCTLQGKKLQCQMTGMPSIGIYNLYITAVAP